MSMTQRFFITGLPRSRTAWMAAYFSMGRTLCYHEPIAELSSLDDLPEFFDAPYYSHVGVADSGLGFHIDWILKHIQPRTLIIDRPLCDVDAALARLGFPKTTQTQLLQRALDRCGDHPLVRRISYSSLDNPRAMERAFFHLMPGIPFDQVRHEQFCRLNIQADMQRCTERVRNNSAGIHRVLGDIFQQVQILP